MGVMRCNRGDCQNILADYLVDGDLYFCGRCYGELTDFVRRTPCVTVGEVQFCIRQFARTDAPDENVEGVSVLESLTRKNFGDMP